MCQWDQFVAGLELFMGFVDKKREKTKEHQQPYPLNAGQSLTGGGGVQVCFN